MTKLIEELKNEHAHLAETLNQVKELGFTSKEGQEALLTARTSFLEHLKKEDKQLYPVLNRTAKNDPKLRRTMEIFAKDMDQISEAANQFFNKYKGVDSSLEFARDFGHLLAVLKQRITKEENVIYEQYDQIATS